MIKVYKINNKTELDIFNKIHSSNISPDSRFPYYCRYGSTYWDLKSDSIGWTIDLNVYKSVDYELRGFFDLYLNQL